MKESCGWQNYWQLQAADLNPATPPRESSLSHWLYTVRTRNPPEKLQRSCHAAHCATSECALAESNLPERIAIRDLRTLRN